MGNEDSQYKNPVDEGKSDSAQASKDPLLDISTTRRADMTSSSLWSNADGDPSQRLSTFGQPRRNSFELQGKLEYLFCLLYAHLILFFHKDRIIALFITT
ncbi:unnamed protein product [Protopolystoma xenopodis]|uniref:Uncharacterized protein n=1 Tax=Protopolystoma xenopodis TaxID=117903 RepID=A0A3S5FE45_9PLAT|nr:unnamed protein product [Protopolystoma xenopodis]